MKYGSIAEFNTVQSEQERPICELLMREINQGLPQAESKIWHGHPVWFLMEIRPLATAS